MLPSDRLSFIILLIVTFEVCVAEQSELICSHQPIVAMAGDDVILPCYLDPPISASSETVVWTKPGLDPKYIHFHRDGRLIYDNQNPSYNFRTRLFVDELQNGNVSMKIFNAKISDAGKYFCILESMLEEASIQLTVGVVSTPIIEVVSNNSGRVVLQCESKGWYPEPEVVWLDGEGNLLSAGPTETVRGPDDLYTVSSRVTVEKRHSNNFTCRVQQKDINKTRETHIYVQDVSFTVQSSSDRIRIIIILPVCIIVLFIITTLIICTKRNQKNETEQEEEEGQQQDVKTTEFLTQINTEDERQKTLENTERCSVQRRRLKRSSSDGELGARRELELRKSL
ncbi:butyrophilin subfamily 2 member A2 isoform X13 [Dicentrarchus labrax]|uniref:butyrophilin subfamily 2 member A2 isoform X13 n=1 Tax=Dicentrarchus labrax TaxID=13489 RepID=UPI0021F6656E|nr:butyrophilin subfamily 2 member A2 isoform X13 [Dicentrarchus labrax]